MKQFEFLDHTADVQFLAYGKNLNELFENSALALFESMIDTDTIESKMEYTASVNSENIERLLFLWLSELVFIFDSKKYVFKSFNVDINKKDEEYSLIGKIKGEKIDIKKHKFNSEVKAATYHNMEINKNGIYKAKVVLDT